MLRRSSREYRIGGGAVMWAKYQAVGLMSLFLACACLNGRLISVADQAAEVYGSPTGTKPFAPNVYRDRRQHLMNELKDGVAVLYSAASLASGQRQDTDFAYLTGLIDEVGAILVLAPQETLYRETLFLQPRNPDLERWEGTRLSLGQAIEQRTGFERVRRIDQSFDFFITALVAHAGKLQFLGPIVSPDKPIPPELTLYIKLAARIPGTVVQNRSSILPKMRSVKTSSELELMRAAVNSTKDGLLAAMRHVRPGMREYELKDIIENTFRKAGARGLSFASIVGTGRNAAIIHYRTGDTIIADDDLVLCDVGAEYQHYAGDLTRTFPGNGKFTPKQRELYELVLRAQEAAMAKLRAGVYLDAVQTAADAVIRKAGYGDNFRHVIGHFVGLDVHDTGDYFTPLPVGAVVTIEPGIYLPVEGIGIRIEDEFLVTETGFVHLSEGLPRTVEEIERFMANR